ncbi:MAG: hypothetical protein S4CHLAM2_16330 [Chlamydiales bacterium]|nr:hypothetical protein [Chlamydiales bacterium]
MFFLAEQSALAEFASPEAIGQSYNYWGQFVNMLLTLGFILILIFLSVYLLKRLMRSRIHHLNRSTGIRILERRALNSKASLYIVDVLGKGVVLSESASGIQVVTEFAEGANVEEMLDQIQEEPTAIRESFANKLKRLASKNA